MLLAGVQFWILDSGFWILDSGLRACGSGAWSTCELCFLSVLCPVKRCQHCQFTIFYDIYFNVTNIGQSYDSKFLCQHYVKPQQGSQSSYCVTQPFADPAGIFWVMVISGNISHCQDCSGKILQGESGKPLYDLVVQHKEHVLFQNPRSRTFKLSREFRNVYYHPRLSYIRNKISSFQAS